MKDYAVIIPIHNGEEFIFETIKSIDMQTHQPKEIIIVDDCSTDNTKNLLLNIKDNIKTPIKFLELETNSGTAAKPRNFGLKNINNVEFIAFCDADDVWHKAKMENQIRIMEESAALFSFSNVNFFTGSNILPDDHLEKIEICKLELRDFRFNNCIKSCSTAVIRKSLLEICHFPEGLRYRGIEDYYCWLQILSSIEFVIKIENKLTNYRQHSQSISSSKLSMVKLRYKTFNFKKNIFKNNGIFLPMFAITEFIYIFKQLITKR